MRRLAFLTLGALTGAAAFGQDLLECVDPAVVHGLLLRTTASEMTLSTAVPPEFNSLAIPAEFSFIGSKRGEIPAPRQATSISAAYRTGFPPDAAINAAVNALAAEGWQMNEQLRSIGMSVFTSAGDAVSRTGCREDDSVIITVSEVESVTYVIYGTSRGGNSSACASQLWLGASASGTSSDGIRNELPALAMPADPATGLPVRPQGGGSGGGGADYNARTEFRLDDSLGNVTDHFARQMAEQGWTGDANWSGTSTAGSTWSKQTDADTTVYAELHVTAFDDAQYTVVLRAVALQ